MTQPHDALTMNACLARVIGKEIWWSGGPRCVYLFEDSGGNSVEWNPLHDANQLEEVEAWLKQNGIEFIISSAHLCNLMIVELILANGIFQGKDPDKKRAFALAIYQMEQANEKQP